MAKKVKGTQSGETSTDRIRTYAKPQVDKRTEGEKRRDARRKKIKNIPKDQLYSTGKTTSEKISDFANKMHDKFGAALGMSAKDIEFRARRRLNHREVLKQIEEAQDLKKQRLADIRDNQKKRKEAREEVRKKELKKLKLYKGGVVDIVDAGKYFKHK
tara:strand:- start:1547 stop:2020 length:474 start_codon:yes stop_codon:yes gene_type:complete